VALLSVVIWRKKGADKAADASKDAAQTQASSEQAALDYQIEREALPRQFSEGALKGLGGLYGLEGGTGNQQDLIDRAISLPAIPVYYGWSRSWGRINTKKCVHDWWF